MTRRDRKITEKTSHEVETTRELILAELEEARQIAKKARNGSAMAMASLGKAKVQGLIIDRREIGDVGDFTNKTDEELMEEAKQRAERRADSRVARERPPALDAGERKFGPCRH